MLLKFIADKENIAKIFAEKGYDKKYSHNYDPIKSIHTSNGDLFINNQGKLVKEYSSSYEILTENILAYEILNDFNYCYGICLVQVFEGNFGHLNSIIKFYTLISGVIKTEFDANITKENIYKNILLKFGDSNSNTKIAIGVTSNFIGLEKYTNFLGMSEIENIKGETKNKLTCKFYKNF